MSASVEVDQRKTVGVYTCMRMRFRVVLPVSLGIVSLAFIIWDLYNLRVIGTMGMAWDTGAPVWPYQASLLLQQAINAPAFVLAAPFFFLPHLQTMEERYLVLLPVILLWWWWLGTRIDFGILGREQFRRPRLFAFLLAGIASALLYTGTRIIIDAAHRWLIYGPPHLLLLTQTAGAALWSFALACGCLFGTLRLLQRRFPAVGEQRRPFLGYGFAFISLVAIATSLIGIVGEEKIDPDSCVVSNDTGCVHGTIADENGTPVKGIEVELLLTDKTGEPRWYSRKYAWTDKKGRYSVTGLEPGKYLVGVHYYDAPNLREPFATTFYPGADAETDAEPVVVGANSRAMLTQFRLRSLPLTTVRVEVVWPDGTRPERSNLAFHNLSYPSQAVIGDVAPQIDDGTGEFTLPEGFDYDARATVQCDAGRLIESRESPVQQIKVGGRATPKSLTFTIPGPACKLWQSK
jgi:hypothetical protein